MNNKMTYQKCHGCSFCYEWIDAEIGLFLNCQITKNCLLIKGCPIDESSEIIFKENNKGVIKKCPSIP